VCTQTQAGYVANLNRQCIQTDGVHAKGMDRVRGSLEVCTNRCYAQRHRVRRSVVVCTN
jgi:hypothetical protein